MIAIVIAAAVLAPTAWSGEEFLTPTLREGSGYESSDPHYRVVGAEDIGANHVLYVVAEPADVLTQKGINRIILDAQRRKLSFTAILFYSSVRDRPRSASFALADQLALYLYKDNKTYYGVAAKELYGGWAHGPPRLQDR